MIMVDEYQDGGHDNVNGNDVHRDETDAPDSGNVNERVANLKKYELAGYALKLLAGDGGPDINLKGGVLARKLFMDYARFLDDYLDIFHRTCDEELIESGGNFAKTFQARFVRHVAEELYSDALNGATLNDLAEYTDIELSGDVQDKFESLENETYKDVIDYLKKQQEIRNLRSVNEDKKKELGLGDDETFGLYAELYKEMNRLLDYRQNVNIEKDGAGIADPTELHKLEELVRNLQRR